MKLNNTVTLKVKNNNIYTFIKLLSSFKIYYFDLIKENDYFYISTGYNNLNKIKKLLKKEDYEIIYIKGIIGLKKLLKDNYIYFIGLFIGLTLLFILTNTIFEININSKDPLLIKTLEENLESYGIKKYALKKDYSTLENIKKNILKSNKDLFDWLSIEASGVTYKINFTKRVNKTKTPKKKISSIVASKDTVIKHIEYSSGVVLKEVNDYVKKGEVIISGNIIKSDKYLKAQVQSKGKVYGEVWYKVKVSVPFNYIEYKETGVKYNEYYIKLFNKKITLINKYNLKNIMSEESVYIEKPYLPFKIYQNKVREYKYFKKVLTEDEAYTKATYLAEQKIKDKLKDGEYIIDKKVLKKQRSSSKISIEIFFKVYESVSLEKEIEEIEVGTDISKKGD